MQWVVVNQGSQWQLALHFFGQMDLVRLSPDSISYNAATGLQIGAQFQQRLGWLFGYPWNGDIHQICQSEWLLNDIISENCEIGMLWNKCYWYWFSFSRLTLFQDFPPVRRFLWDIFGGTFGGIAKGAISRNHLVKLFGAFLLSFWVFWASRQMFFFSSSSLELEVSFPKAFLICGELPLKMEDSKSFFVRNGPLNNKISLFCVLLYVIGIPPKWFETAGRSINAHVYSDG